MNTISRFLKFTTDLNWITLAVYELLMRTEGLTCVGGGKCGANFTKIY